MACGLTKSTKPNVDFEGNTGDQVKLGVSSDSGGATIVSVVYDGNAVTTLDGHLGCREQVPDGARR